MQYQRLWRVKNFGGNIWNMEKNHNENTEWVNVRSR